MNYSQVKSIFRKYKEEWLSQIRRGEPLSLAYRDTVLQYLVNRSGMALNDSQRNNLLKFANGKANTMVDEILGNPLKADQIFEKHLNWLKVEGNHVAKAGQQIRQWTSINNSVFKGYKLQWVTAGDEKVRHEHRLFDGVTLSKDDKFWQEQFPGQAPNCRCTYKLVRGGGKKLTTDMLNIPSPNQWGFNVNAGFNGLFFGQNHSYMK